MDHILYETSDGIARITINRPDRRNAMSSETYQQLHAVVDEFTAAKDVHVAVLTGAGDHFTIGGDMTSYVATSVEEWKQGPPPYSINLNAALWRCPKPLIVGVKGYCVGWGMVALGAADFRVVASNAKLGYSGALRFFGGAGSGGFIERLGLQIPYVHAIDLLLTGRLVTAEEARRINLVNEVVEPEMLEARTLELAQTVLRMPPMVQRTIKSALRRVQSQIVDNLAETTDREGRLYFHSDDFAEGMRSWAEKRDPVWSGR